MWVDSNNVLWEDRPEDAQYEVTDLSVWAKWNRLPRGEYWDIVNGVFTLLPKSKTEADRQNAVQRIAQLKKYLADTDYLVMKHSEGVLSEERWEASKKERQSWRDEINTLERRYSIQ